ncbi:MAG: DUF6440 family protein [Pseudomonadota bacterium]
MQRTGLVMCLMGAAMLGGCDGGQSSYGSAPSQDSAVQGSLRTSTSANRRIRVWSDPETGCQYLIWGRSGRGGMTPRLKPDGMPVCKPVAPAARATTTP